MCALHWSWAFGNETTTDLAAMGWSTGGAVYQSITTDTDKVYTYTGSPTRYGWILVGNSGYFVIPPAATSGLSSGWLAVPFKSLAASSYYNGQNVLRVDGTSGVGIFALVTPTGALSLYVANAFKETTAAIDWTSWKYVALKWDMSANPWSGQLYIDGVAATSAYTQAQGALTVGNARIGPGPARFGAADVLCSQIIVWGSAADAGETPYYATRVEPTADGTNVGTWTPSTGLDDYAVVDSPFDTATYTQDASPSASDRCEVVTSTIATALGITPATVAGVTAHTFSEGQAVVAKAVVGPSGGAETSGSNVTIDASSTTYAMATSTATFTGSDTIDVIYEVVST